MLLSKLATWLIGFLFFVNSKLSKLAQLCYKIKFFSGLLRKDILLMIVYKQTSELLTRNVDKSKHKMWNSKKIWNHSTESSNINLELISCKIGCFDLMYLKYKIKLCRKKSSLLFFNSFREQNFKKKCFKSKICETYSDQIILLQYLYSSELFRWPFVYHCH